MITASILKGDDFSGGLVTKSSELNLQPNQSPDCLNVHSDIFKSLSKRLGYAKLNSVSQAAACNGIYNYIRTETEQHLISLWAQGFTIWIYQPEHGREHGRQYPRIPIKERH